MKQMEVRHYLTFEFAGIGDKFVYTVSEGVKKAVQHELLHRNWEIAGSVIEFEESGGRKIAVNAEYVRRCQALFDAGVYPPESEEEIKPDMMIVLEGMTEPLYYNDIDPDDAALVASVMAGVDSDTCNFVSFIDEDGEDNMIPVDRVMLLDSIHYEDEFDEHQDD